MISPLIPLIVSLIPLIVTLVKVLIAWVLVSALPSTAAIRSETLASLAIPVN